MLTIPSLKTLFATRKYTWYKDRPNLIGIRTNLQTANLFNDIFAVVWTQPEIKFTSVSDKQKKLNKWLFTGANGLPLAEDGNEGNNTLFAWNNYLAAKGNERMKAWTITTNPGVYWLQHPMSNLGTAVLKPGQYTDAYKLGFHQQKTDHPALVQIGNVTVFRDNNLNDKPEESARTETGLFGINIHRGNANGATPSIGKWSAGCQVFQVKRDHDELLRLLGNYAPVDGKFSYTLVKESELS